MNGKHIVNFVVNTSAMLVNRIKTPLTTDRVEYNDMTGLLQSILHIPVVHFHNNIKGFNINAYELYYVFREYKT